MNHYITMPQMKKPASVRLRALGAMLAIAAWFAFITTMKIDANDRR